VTSPGHSIPPPALEAIAEGEAVGTNLRRGQVLRDMFWGGALARTGTILLIFILLFCFLGPHIYHTDQIHPTESLLLKAPSGKHPLGTDGSGFDELGRLMKGGQSSLEIGFASAVIASIFGTLYGGIAGYFGGVIDAIMMRAVDTLLAFPSILLLLLLAVIYGTKLGPVILIIAAFAWLSPARLVRGETLTLRTRDYVAAARLAGARSPRIILRHVLPNALGTIVVNTTFVIADGILALSTLSFIGLGPPLPATDWGAILNDGVDYGFYWWLIYPAGIAIVLAILAFNFLGEGLEAALGARNRS
jgi:peptide/nickel transport system permease protein